MVTVLDQIPVPPPTMRMDAACHDDRVIIRVRLLMHHLTHVCAWLLGIACLVGGAAGIVVSRRGDIRQWGELTPAWEVIGWAMIGIGAFILLIAWVERTMTWRIVLDGNKLYLSEMGSIVEIPADQIQQIGIGQRIGRIIAPGDRRPFRREQWVLRLTLPDGQRGSSGTGRLRSSVGSPPCCTIFSRLRLSLRPQQHRHRLLMQE